MANIIVSRFRKISIKFQYEYWTISRRVDTNFNNFAEQVYEVIFGNVGIFHGKFTFFFFFCG